MKMEIPRETKNKNAVFCEFGNVRGRILRILPLHVLDTFGVGNVALCIGVFGYMWVEYDLCMLTNSPFVCACVLIGSPLLYVFFQSFF